MITVDWWSWKCAQCGWEAKSQLTVNPQQAVAEALIRLHIQEHAAVVRSIEMSYETPHHCAPSDYTAMIVRLQLIESGEVSAMDIDWRTQAGVLSRMLHYATRCTDANVDAFLEEYAQGLPRVEEGRQDEWLAAHRALTHERRLREARQLLEDAGYAVTEPGLAGAASTPEPEEQP